ncbi:DUF5955 family protein [Streptomyces sp. H10-C2]|uniref:DUF5955 family protein n=1 Tax=unclassified Streptomyces TaxID=2593676 RepID=UPI0024B9F1D9|nr:MULTISPECIES: DUF5955 family protein [unclassified Streptomyces]MDJ0340778.1 DUF5955 family protein [Streptomyces sp. PH10-H1]MDJ0371950.1 DUF5955 family protein [Streptomyces sp. H10-C2]
MRAEVPPGADDPRVTALRLSVARVRRELAALRSELPDRAIAEDELDSLAAATDAGLLETERLRHSLLLIAAALGSVSALASALAELRRAVDLFGSGGFGSGGGTGPGAREGL